MWVTQVNRRLLKWAAGAGIGLAVILGSLPAALEYRDQGRNGWEVQNTRVVATISSPTVSPTPTPRPVPTVPLNREIIMKLSQGETQSVAKDLPQQEIRTVVLGGDVMMGRSVGFDMTRKADFGYPFKMIGKDLAMADMTVVNLENPIVENCPLTDDGMIFCSTPGTVGTLKEAGVDMVNLANNHMLNYGGIGLNQTVKYLSEQEIGYAGLGTLGVVNVRGVKVGMLGFLQLGGTGGVLAETSVDTIKDEIAKVRGTVDILLVTFHWGNEYQGEPTLAQRMLGLAAAEGGADVVFGHHPHWVQGFEVYEGVPVFYSLGNLVFDQMWSEETREGMVVELTFYKDTLLEVKLKPIFMEFHAQPNWQPVGYGNRLMEKVDRLSQKLEETQQGVAGLVKNK